MCVTTTRRDLCLGMAMAALGGWSGLAEANDGLLSDLASKVEDEVKDTEVDLKARQARDLAIEAYVYAYPLVTMELTRRHFTNVAAPEGSRFGCQDYGGMLDNLLLRRVSPDCTISPISSGSPMLERSKRPVRLSS